MSEPSIALPRTLADLRPGDEVAIVGHYGLDRVTTVDRVTPTGRIVVEGRQHSPDGIPLGEPHGAPRWLESMTEGHRAILALVRVQPVLNGLGLSMRRGRVSVEAVNRLVAALEAIEVEIHGVQP